MDTVAAEGPSDSSFVPGSAPFSPFSPLRRRKLILEWRATRARTRDNKTLVFRTGQHFCSFLKFFLPFLCLQVHSWGATDTVHNWYGQLLTTLMQCYLQQQNAEREIIDKHIHGEEVCTHYIDPGSLQVTSCFITSIQILREGWEKRNIKEVCLLIPVQQQLLQAQVIRRSV